MTWPWAVVLAVVFTTFGFFLGAICNMAAATDNDNQAEQDYKNVEGRKAERERTEKGKLIYIAPGESRYTKGEKRTHVRARRTGRR